MAALTGLRLDVTNNTFRQHLNRRRFFVIDNASCDMRV